MISFEFDKSISYQFSTANSNIEGGKAVKQPFKIFDNFQQIFVNDVPIAEKVTDRVLFGGTGVEYGAQNQRELRRR